MAHCNAQGHLRLELPPIALDPGALPDERPPMARVVHIGDEAWSLELLH